MGSVRVSVGTSSSGGSGSPSVIREGSISWNPIAENGYTISPSITVPGAEFGDFLDVAAPYDLQGLITMAYVTANNTAVVVVYNPSTDPIELGTGIWKIRKIDGGTTAKEGALDWEPDGNISPAITVPGAVIGDYVDVSPPYDLQGAVCHAYVSAANTVKIAVFNPTTAPITLPVGTWKVRVLGNVGGGAPLSNEPAKNLGVAAPGVSGLAAREDHVHKMPSAVEVGAAPVSHEHDTSDINDFTEYVQDIIATTVRAGSNVSVAYDDDAGALTISASGGGGNGTNLGSLIPSNLGAPSPGASIYAAREDHVHKMPSAADVGAAPTSHTHTAEQVVGLAEAAMDAAAGMLVAGNAIQIDRFDEADAVIISTSAAEVGNATPMPLGATNVGLSNKAAREDHVHPKPSLGDLGAAPASHTHSAADITGLSTSLTAKADKTLANVANADFAAKAVEAGVTGNVGGTGAVLTNATPQPLGTAATGTATTAARADHVHAMPTAAQVGAAPAAHTHTIANVTGLQAALDGKSGTDHTHAIANVTGLQEALNAKANSAHSHAISEVTGLSAELANKANTADVSQLRTEVDGIKATIANGGGTGGGTTPPPTTTPPPPPATSAILVVNNKPGLVGGPHEGMHAQQSPVSGAPNRCYQTYHFVSDGEWVRPRLFYINKAISASLGTVNGPSPITIKASIRTAAGRVVPVTFDGDSRASADGRSITLQPGQSVWSDPVPVRLAAPGFHVRTNVSASGGSWYTAAMWGSTELGEGYNTTDFTDAANAPTLTWSYRFGPAVVEAEQGAIFSPKPRVVIFGSSSGNGAMDEPDVASGFHYGYLSRLMGNNGIHYQRSAESGDTLYSFNNNWTVRRQILQAANPHFVIQQAGSNDISGSASLSTMQDRIREAVAKVYGLGILSVLVTVTPSTNSNTDLTPKSTAQNTTRLSYNAWLKTKPFPGIYDVLDVAAITDSSSTGVWKSGSWVVSDGLHPSPYAHQQVAAALNTQVSNWRIPT